MNMYWSTNRITILSIQLISIFLYFAFCVATVEIAIFIPTYISIPSSITKLTFLHIINHCATLSVILLLNVVLFLNPVEVEKKFILNRAY